MSQADERDDGRGFHEINVPALSAEQRPSAVAKRRRRTERDERVHVRAANLELPPGTAVELRASKNLHSPGQRERHPLKPPLQAPAENPLTPHQRHRAEYAEPQIQMPARWLRFTVIVRSPLNGFGFVAGVLDRGDDGGNIRW